MRQSTLADTDSAKVLLDGMQHSVPALAARGKEADMLTPERRSTFSATEHCIHSLGRRAFFERNLASYGRSFFVKISQYESQLAAYNAQYSGGGGSVAQNAFAGAASDRPEALARFGGAAAGVGEQALEAYATAQQQRTPVDLVPKRCTGRQPE